MPDSDLCSIDCNDRDGALSALRLKIKCSIVVTNYSAVINLKVRLNRCQFQGSM